MPNYLLIMSDFDGDQDYYNITNQEWWDWLAVDQTDHPVPPADLSAAFAENIVAGDGIYGVNFNDFWERCQIVAIASESMPDRDRIDTYDDHAEGRWY